MYTPNSRVPRLVLPLKSRQRIMPKIPTEVGAFATEGIDVEQIFISAASSKGGAADWIVHDVVIAGRSQLRYKDLPGFLFNTGGLSDVPRSSSAISFDGLDVIGQGQEFKIVVSYVGQNPEGADFIASVVGHPPGVPPHVLPMESVQRVPHGETVRIVARLTTAAFRPELLEIDGDASAWTVRDIKVNGRSQFAQAGDVPGDMFATSAIGAFVSMDTCLTGNPIEIIATYLGKKQDGERFVARYEGTIAAVDPANPPELRALVSSALGYSGPEGDVGEAVVATKSSRPRSRAESAALVRRDDTVAPVGVDLIEQCSVLVKTRKLLNVDTVIEARIVNPPDPEIASLYGRKLAFFVVTSDGKRAEIAASAVDALIALG